jgi:hypothetical protein
MECKDLPLGVVAASLLEGLGEDGDSRVDGVRDDEDEGLGASVGNSLGEGSADASVDLDMSANRTRTVIKIEGRKTHVLLPA